MHVHSVRMTHREKGKQFLVELVDVEVSLLHGLYLEHGLPSHVRQIVDGVLECDVQVKNGRICNLCCIKLTLDECNTGRVCNAGEEELSHGCAPNAIEDLLFSCSTKPQAGDIGQLVLKSVRDVSDGFPFESKSPLKVLLPVPWGLPSKGLVVYGRGESVPKHGEWVFKGIWDGLSAFDEDGVLA